MRKPTTAGNLVPFRETGRWILLSKLPAGPPVASAPEEFCSSTLLFLEDILSDREFLVDSGASVSVFPGPWSSSDDRVRLFTEDGSRMVCSGTGLIPLHFSCSSSSRVFTWNFQLASVSVPLLGADFLEHFNLLVDIKGRKSVHADCPEDVIVRALPGPQFWRSILMSSPLKGFQPQNLVTGSGITS